MADATVISNGHLAWFAGPDSAISEANWNSGPTLAQLQTLVNHSAGIKIDGTDFGAEASDQVDDRSFADQAGAQSRGFQNASGSLEVYVPGEGDTTSAHAKAYDTFTKPRTRLALAQRAVKAQSAAIAPGDEINLFRVETDSRQHNRNDASRTTGVGLVYKGVSHINYIVPASTPTAPTASKSTVAVAVGDAAFVDITYQGRNVTAGAKYISSNEAVATVTPGGTILGVGAGTATITYSIPGGAAPASGITVTVS